MNIYDLNTLMAKPENEHLEFKEAKSSFSILGDKKNSKSVLWYCVALWNEGWWNLILWISDKIPREIVGTSALKNIEDVKSKIYSNIGIRIKIHEIYNENKRRIVVIIIPSRKTWEVLRLKLSFIP